MNKQQNPLLINQLSQCPPQPCAATSPKEFDTGLSPWGIPKPRLKGSPVSPAPLYKCRHHLERVITEGSPRSRSHHEVESAKKAPEPHAIALAGRSEVIVIRYADKADDNVAYCSGVILP